jgi:pimeloyl-ACP methyl ester carboxylesterase
VNFQSLYFSSSDGLKLHARVYEPAGMPAQTVVCLAGLTRNARDFDGLATKMAKAGLRVVAMDSRGRGGSAFAKSAADYNIITEAQDVLAGLAAMGIEHASFIGTSRGGLILHTLAAMRPTALRAAILNDIGPVIEPDGLLQIRSYLQSSPRPKNWADAVSVQKAVHGKAFPALSDEDWARHARAIYKEDSKGNITADFDPKIAQTLSNLNADTRLPAIWFQFAGLKAFPLMVIRGENSRLLSKKTFEEMGKRHPNCLMVTAEGQGHAPHLDVGDLSTKIISFLTPQAARKK